jgi:dTDP-4-dehydrorhamnose reductase
VPHVLPISTADYPTPARRPAWSVLDNAGFEREVGIRLPDWRDGLREVMDRLAG